MTRRNRGWLILGVWTAYGLLGTMQEHISYAMSRGTPLPWSTSLLLQMPQAVQESIGLRRSQQTLRQGAKLCLNFLIAHGVLVMASVVGHLGGIVLA